MNTALLKFGWEFTLYYPRQKFPHVTIEEYNALHAEFVDQRLAWELEHGWAHEAAKVVGILLMLAFVGVIIWALAEKSKEKAIKGIRDKIGMQLAALEETRKSTQN